MQKIKLIILLNLFISLTMFSQKQNTNAKNHGSRICSIEDIETVETLNDAIYIVHKNPIVIRLNDRTIKNNLYKSIKDYISNRSGKFKGPGIHNINPPKRDSVFNAEKEDFIKNTQLSIVSEFNFKIKGKKYSSVSFYLQYKKICILYNYIFENIDNYWVIFNSKQELSRQEIDFIPGLFCIKPEIMVEYLNGKRVFKDTLVNTCLTSYFKDGIYNTQKTFPPVVYYMYYNRYKSVLIPPFKVYKSKSNVRITPKEDFKIVLSWSFDIGRFMNYENTKRSVKKIYFDELKRGYDSIPEFALATWCFALNEAEKKPHSLDYDRSKVKYDRFFTYIQEGDHSQWHIDPKYKVVFYDKKQTYCLIFFDEWYDGNKKGMFCRLLTWKNGRWFIDDRYPLDFEPTLLGTIFNSLKPDVLESLLSGNPTGNSEIDNFVSKMRWFNNRLQVSTALEIYTRNKKDFMLRELPMGWRHH